MTRRVFSSATVVGVQGVQDIHCHVLVVIIVALGRWGETEIKRPVVNALLFPHTVLRTCDVVVKSRSFLGGGGDCIVLDPSCSCQLMTVVTIQVSRTVRLGDR